MLQKVRPKYYTFGTTILFASALVFLLFFSLYGSVKLLYPGQLTSGDDPYFHARYAELLAEGVQSPPLPYVSTMNRWGGGTLYYGYHTILATLITLTDATESDSRLLMVTKVFNAFLAALTFATFFYITAHTIRLLFPNHKYTSRIIVGVSVLSTILLATVFPQFLLRLSYERPFILSVILMLVLLHAVLAQKKRVLFFVGALLPLVYSLTLIAFIPLFVYAVVYLRVFGYKSWPIPARIVGIFTAGLTLGILLHPTSLHYVFNAYYVHLRVLYNALTSSIPLGGEIKPVLMSVVDYPWLVLSSLLIVVFIHLWNKHTLATEQKLLFLSALSVVYIPLQILFPRTVEYYGPVAILTGTLFGLYLITHHRHILHAIAGYFTKVQKALLATILILYIGAGTFGSVYAMTQNPAQWPISGEKGLYDELRKHASPGDRVVLPVFHTFATAYFFMPELSYSQGMDPTFSLLASSSAFWLLQNAVRHPETICPLPECTDASDTVDVYSVLRDTYDARFVILDYPIVRATTTDTFPEYVVPLLELINHFSHDESSTGGRNEENPYESFSDTLISDERFRVLYDATVMGRRFLLWEIR
jgi:hypothetical protein